MSKMLPSKNVWVGWISSTVEAYNMAIYSFSAPFLAKYLFQHTSSGESLFFSYSLVFLGTCLLYPLGALYYGSLGDRKGRQYACVYSTLGLGMATGLMGIVPLTQYGWICFLVLIGIQHFFSGGEYHGSIVFSLEHAEQCQGGMMSAMSCLFAVFGLAAANGLATLSFLMENEYWMRGCFFVGGIGGLISYLLKYHCHETPPFSSLPAGTKNEIKLTDFIKLEGRTLIAVVATLAFFIVSYTFIFIFLPLVNIERSVSHPYNTFKSLIGYGIFLIAAGWLADQTNTKSMMLSGLCFFSILIIPLSYLCNNMFVLQMILAACACLVIGPIHSWMLQQFKVQHRCRGIFISAAIATSIFGGSTVPICLIIFEYSHSLAICGIYPLIIAFSTFCYLYCFIPNEERRVIAKDN